MKTHIKETNVRDAAFAVLTLVFLALLPGCANDDSQVNAGKGQGTLSFTLGGISEGEPEAVTRAQVSPEVVTQELGDGLFMTSTLTPDGSSKTRASSVMTIGNKYKLVVLDASNKIVGSVDGVAGTQTPKIPLAAGTYTAIAYSYNDNTTSLPDPGTVGATIGSITIPGGKDLLYWSQTSVVVGASETKVLPITFSHKYSKVNVVVDASLMAANVNATTVATLGKSYDATIALVDGTVTTSGAASTTPVAWNTLGAQNVTSDNIFLFSNGETPLTLTFSTLTIGGTAYTNKSITFARSLEAGKSYTLTVNLYTALPVPATITLAQNQKYMLASVYDNNYLPYTAPTVAAATGTSSPDGTNETLVDFQGTITTSGITVRIPVASAPTASGTLLGYSKTVTVPLTMIEGGGSTMDLTFSWAVQSYTTSTKYITANIKAVGSTFNALKLDINKGVGNDYLGVLLAQFSYPYNSAGNTTTFQLRDIAPIPDKMYGVADNSGSSTSHRMLYVPVVAEDGNIWLNNNLGAHYANINHASFNLAKQATGATDYLAYGSLFQWGRKPDGHELITWTNGTTGTPVNGTTTIRNNAPTDALFILNGTIFPYDWRGLQDNSLWATAASANNPCPEGFRVPTVSEQNSLVTAADISNSPTAASSLLKFTVPGNRSGTLGNTGMAGYYWSSSISGAYATYRIFNTGTTSGNDLRASGYSVRCIKD